ncbi:hypothetical protein FIBSPDRAFT_872335, partial [Athelia psychrophila]
MNTTSLRPAVISDQRLPMPGGLMLSSTGLGDCSRLDSPESLNQTPALKDRLDTCPKSSLTAAGIHPVTLRARLNSLLPAPGRPNATFLGPAPETLRIAGDEVLSESAADIHAFV